jgi:hypothetical protein
MLYCFFVIVNDRRRILHWEVTRYPTSSWVTQQLRETFPYDSSPWSPNTPFLAETLPKIDAEFKKSDHSCTWIALWRGTRYGFLE